MRLKRVTNERPPRTQRSGEQRPRRRDNRCTACTGASCKEWQRQRPAAPETAPKRMRRCSSQQRTAQRGTAGATQTAHHAADSHNSSSTMLRSAAQEAGAGAATDTHTRAPTPQQTTQQPAGTLHARRGAQGVWAAGTWARTLRRRRRLPSFAQPAAASRARWPRCAWPPTRLRQTFGARISRPRSCIWTPALASAPPMRRLALRCANASSLSGECSSASHRCVHSVAIGDGARAFSRSWRVAGEALWRLRCPLWCRAVAARGGAASALSSLYLTLASMRSPRAPMCRAVVVLSRLGKAVRLPLCRAAPIRPRHLLRAIVPLAAA